MLFSTLRPSPLVGAKEMGWAALACSERDLSPWRAARCPPLTGSGASQASEPPNSGLRNPRGLRIDNQPPENRDKNPVNQGGKIMAKNTGFLHFLVSILGFLED